MEELIRRLRELHQMNIYTVDENWCIQLFELDVCANDYDVQPCPKFESIYETNGTDLQKVLVAALEWADNRIRRVS